MDILSPARVGSRRRWCVGLWVACWLSLTLSVAKAYVLEGIQWPSNQAIELDLQLGSPQGTLADGSTSWDQVFVAATGIWNPYLSSGVQLVTQETSFTPAQGDGKNSVFFATSVFGESFGDDTLATTAYLVKPGTNVPTEADVVFNVNQPLNSYRGPLRANSNGLVYDLRRIALHELGHVLGLAHVPQTTQAIMTPEVTDIDTIQPDDIAGVEAIYGTPAPVVPVINGRLSVVYGVGETIVYQISATGAPTSYQASGLPLGLSLDSSTGFITGTPNTAGIYDVAIGASNGAGTATAILTLVLAETPQITSDLDLTAYVGRPFYYPITTTGQPTDFETDELPAGLSLNQYTGLISGTPTVSGDYTISITASSPSGQASDILEIVVAYDATLAVIQGLSDFSALLEGTDGNLYGATGSGGTHGGGTIFTLTPDGTMTTLYNFDVRLPTNPSTPGDLHQAVDGSFYGTTTRGGANNAGTVFKFTADGMMTTLTNFPALPANTETSPNVLQASDGNYYGTIPPLVPSDPSTYPAGTIYKLTPAGSLTALHTFNNTDGFYPSPLIQAHDGNFYGVTYEGGTSNLGTVFKITPQGTFTTLHNFTSVEGACPLGALLQATDGNFYGTTTLGPAGSGDGTVFRMAADGTLTTFYAFISENGDAPTSALVQDSAGNFYGTASGEYVNTDGANFGLSADVGAVPILFQLTPDGIMTTLHTFVGNDGAPVSLPLVPDQAGNFYGVSEVIARGGELYKETPTAVPLVYAPPPVTLPAITLSNPISQVTLGTGAVGEFTIGLSAVQDHDVTVNLTIKGTGVNGTDYQTLKTTKKLKAGTLSKAIKVTPLGDLGGASVKTVVLTLEPGNGYTVATPGKVKVKILAP